jgi:tRNA modification GTPase
MRSLSGEFSQLVLGLKNQLVELRAQIEAGLDFPEDELDLAWHESTVDRLRHMSLSVGNALTSSSKGRLLVEGAKVTLLGRPNVGKSSLLNRLAREDIAIVTEIPGTTRDALRETVCIGDVPVILSDTAGIRETNDVVERLGVGRALDEMNSADLVLIITDAVRGIAQEDIELAGRIPEDIPRIWVQNKIDLLDSHVALPNIDDCPIIGVSARTGSGIAVLEQAILAGLGCVDLDEGVFSARERHLVSLELVSHAVQRAMELQDLELIAEELRQAQDAIGTIVGEVTSDDLLGEIFCRFCIGK